MHPAKEGFAALPFFDDFDLSTVDILLISQYVEYFPFVQLRIPGIVIVHLEKRGSIQSKAETAAQIDLVISARHCDRRRRFLPLTL